MAALRLHSKSLNEAVALAAVRGSGHGVVGFDLAGDELRYPDLTQYAECFAIARAGGLGLTCHAAEAAAGTAALETVELFGVTRIGHGAHIVDDPRVLERFAALGIAVEVCPSSNRYTGAISDLSGHPAPKFRDAGIAVVLGDDNPRQTDSLLSNERAILRDRLGFDERALRKLDVDSVAHAFLTDAQRTALTAKLGQAAL